MEVIQENISVILQRGKVLKAHKLERGKKIVFEKLHFKPDNAIGKAYNSWFHVRANQLESVELIPDAQTDQDEDKSDLDPELMIDSVKDNRLLNDSHGKSQSLCREEIVGMKASGAKGEEIIDEIVKNSATFSSKTVYSQKKYLKKKKNKHLTNIRILKPTARLMCRMYESREPGKICHMRLDTLAQILNMANIHHSSNVIVVETCSGLLLSLAMQRLGGAGTIVNLHTGETPTNFHAVTHLNFSDQFWSTLHSLPLGKIGMLLANKDFKDVFGEITQIDEMIGNLKHINKKVSESSEKSCFQNDTNNKDDKLVLSEEEKCEIRRKRKQKRLQHQLCAWNKLKERNMDVAIIACRFHPTPVLLPILEFLAPSRPFVVYCENREPLMELFVQLTASAKAVNIKISDTFMRQYQVLPEQTHPHVMMSSSGGYLLTGVTVRPPEGGAKPDNGCGTQETIPFKKTKLDCSK